MAKVFGIHTIELRPGVKAEDFEKFVIEEMYSLSREDKEIYLAKGDKGKRAGKYALLIVMESIEARNQAYGTPGGPSPELSEEVKQVLAKYRALCTFAFTDYVVVGK